MVFSWFAPLGSPPRMRGKVALRDHGQFLTGITPAYAGKRRSVTDFITCHWDHPRVCGEKKSASALEPPE